MVLRSVPNAKVQFWERLQLNPPECERLYKTIFSKSDSGSYKSSFGTYTQRNCIRTSAGGPMFQDYGILTNNFSVDKHVCKDFVIERDVKTIAGKEGAGSSEENEEDTESSEDDSSDEEGIMPALAQIN